MSKDSCAYDNNYLLIYNTYYYYTLHTSTYLLLAGTGTSRFWGGVTDTFFHRYIPETISPHSIGSLPERGRSKISTLLLPLLSFEIKIR